MANRNRVRYLLLTDLTDDVGDLQELSVRLECWVGKVRRLGRAGFTLADEQPDPEALALLGEDQELADEEGLAEDV